MKLSTFTSSPLIFILASSTLGAPIRLFSMSPTGTTLLSEGLSGTLIGADNPLREATDALPLRFVFDLGKDLGGDKVQPRAPTANSDPIILDNTSPLDETSQNAVEAGKGVTNELLSDFGRTDLVGDIDDVSAIVTRGVPISTTSSLLPRGLLGGPRIVNADAEARYLIDLDGLRNFLNRNGVTTIVDTTKAILARGVRKFEETILKTKR